MLLHHKALINHRPQRALRCNGAPQPACDHCQCIQPSPPAPPPRLFGPACPAAQACRGLHHRLPRHLAASAALTERIHCPPDLGALQAPPRRVLPQRCTRPTQGRTRRCTVNCRGARCFGCRFFSHRVSVFLVVTRPRQCRELDRSGDLVPRVLHGFYSFEDFGCLIALHEDDGSEWRVVGFPIHDLSHGGVHLFEEFQFVRD